MSKVRIFIDLDGVIADWFGGACEVCGIDVNEERYRNILKKGTMVQDIKEVVQDEEEVWSKIAKDGSGWWRSLKLLPWAYTLYDTMSELGDVAFLTSNGSISRHIRSSSLAAKGKCEWVHDHFDTDALMIAHDKHF